MKKLILDNDRAQAMNGILLEDVRKYAAHRKQNIDEGREDPAYAASLIEQYAEGLLKSVKLIFNDHEYLRVDLRDILIDVDSNYLQNLASRQNKFVALTFTNRTGRR